MKNFSKQRILNKKAFTLAEMMVVILIISIVMVAFAPIITRRTRIDQNHKKALWSIIENTGDNIYRSSGSDDKSVIIGDLITSNNLDSKLIVNSESDFTYTPRNQIRLEYGKTDVANIKATDAPGLLIGKSKANTTLAQDSISIGMSQGTNYELGSGKMSIAIGSSALSKNTTGESNIGIGRNSLFSNTTASRNIAFGNQALYTNTTGSYNTASGSGALYANTTGTTNTTVGYQASHSATTSSYNTIMGGGGLNSSGIPVFVAQTDNGSYDIASGGNSLNVSTGSNNIAMGSSAFINNTSGSNNIGFSTGVAHSNAGGNSNIMMAPFAGYGPMFNYTTTSGNDYNIGIGYNSLRYLGADSTCNTAIGSSSAIFESSLNSDTSGLQTSYKTFIGADSEPNSLLTGTVRKIFFGSQPNMSISSNVYFYGTVYARTSTVTTVSDRRLKNVGAEFNEGLSKIQQLKVYNFTYKEDSKKSPRVGVIAQDLQKIFPNSVTKADDGYLAVRWDEMFYAMINSVKELAAKVTGVDRRIAALEKSNQELRARNKMIATRIAILQKKIK